MNSYPLSTVLTSELWHQHFMISLQTDVVCVLYVLQKKRKQANRDADSLSLCSLDINVSPASIQLAQECVWKTWSGLQVSGSELI